MQSLLLLLPVLASCALDVELELCAAAQSQLADCYGAAAAETYDCTSETAALIVDIDCAELADLETRSDDFGLCSSLGILCPATPIFAPEGDPARYPIVLAHGLGVDYQIFGPSIREPLVRDGHAVEYGTVSRYATVDIRARELAHDVDYTLSAHGADKVNIIAHSMGGLDARYLISALGYGDRVASLVTISTPHRGTLAADAALSLEAMPDRVLRALQDNFAGGRGLEEIQPSLLDLSTEGARRLNRLAPDVEGVYYQSWAGLSSWRRLISPGGRRACEADGGTMHFSREFKRDDMDLELVVASVLTGGLKALPNDGLVTVESARWGDFQGCIPADHYDEYGYPTGGDETTGFYASEFFRTIAYDLAKRGF